MAANVTSQAQRDRLMLGQCRANVGRQSLTSKDDSSSERENTYIVLGPGQFYYMFICPFL